MNGHPPGDDAVAEAVRAVRAGDRDAFAVIVSRYQRRMFGLALMVTRDPVAAEDVAQDALVRAYERLHLYDQQRPFEPWMATITARLAHNWLVKRANVASRESLPVNPETTAATVSDDPLETLIGDESDRRLWRAVSGLTSGQRTVVLLRYRQDLKVNEIAGALGVTPGTVKTLLFRARQQLRRTLSEPTAEGNAR